MASCSCTDHTQLTEGKSFNVYKTSSKKHKQDVIQRMREAKCITKYAKFVCTVCVQHYSSVLPPVLKKIKVSDAEKTVQDIKSGSFSEQEMSEIAKALGEAVQMSIFEDSIGISQLYKNEQFMKTFDVTDYFFKRNCVVTSFLMAAANVSESDNLKKLVLLTTSLDCLYKSRNSSLVSPLAFSENILTYCTTGCKAACTYNDCTSPSGSYTTVKTWLLRKAQDEIQCNNNHDIVTFFDNNQVIGRNWRVNFDYKCKSSVVTTVLHIVPDSSSNLQLQVRLSPFHWLYSQQNSLDTCNKISEFIKLHTNNFEYLRSNFIENRLQIVFSEQKKLTNGTVVDDIDNLSKEPKSSNTDPYEFVENRHSKVPPEVFLGEPYFLNPCSYDSVQEVIEKLIEKIVSSSPRSWTIIGCDGLPYNLAQRIIEVNPALQNIILVPGLGHYEMNMVKCVFKILWNVVLEDLVKMLGFKSVRALASIHSCSDHHKAWQVIIILFFGTMDELMLSYVRKCVTQNKKVCLSDFYHHLSSAKDPNYIFLAEFTFTFLMSLYFFRCGIRRNNQMYILSGKTAFCSLFFITNMTNYQEIEYRDLKTRVSAPPEVSDFLTKTETVSMSGHPSKGEGGDFVLEAWNRKIKRMLPPGLPSQTDWKRVCSNLENLSEIRDNIESILDIKKSTSYYQRDLTEEILRWRKKLRESEYLDKPDCEREHRSLSGQILDHDLVNFKSLATQNRQLYLEDIKAGNKPGKGRKLDVIFVTPQDRDDFHSVERKTKKEIENMIKEGINEIRLAGESAQAQVLQRQWDTEICRGTKKEFLQFYFEVTVALEDATGHSDDTSSEEESD